MSSGWSVTVLDGAEGHADHQAKFVMVLNASSEGTGRFASFGKGRSSIATTGGRT